MKNFLLLFILFTMFSACRNKAGQVDKENPKVALLEADRAFSKLSNEKGMKAAFIEYIDSNGVLLKPAHLPIAGANAIDYLIQQNDTGFILTWQPHDGFVSESADLGYTYGIYSLKPSVSDTVFYGTYVTIWKKQANGGWKFVLDSGNEGLGEADQ